MRRTPRDPLALARIALTAVLLAPFVQAAVPTRPEPTAGPSAGAVAESSTAYAQTLVRVDALLARYPQWVAKHPIGTSREGRELFVLCITDSVDPTAPEVYFGSGIHGSEGSQHDGLWMVEQLLARADQAPVAELLANRVLWYQPLVNPDGVAAHRRTNAAGVDLNRNFGHRFTPYDGSGRDRYPGEAPFTEPETVALRDFLSSRSQLRAFVDLHRSAELVLAPYLAGGGAEVEPCATAARELGAAMGRPYAKPFEHRQLWNDQGGFAADWVWGELGVMAFVWELPFGDDDYAFREDHRWRGLLHVLAATGSYPREARPAASPGIVVSPELEGL